jgi:glyoxylase-like metal-dependent hydrolase (beta-lactamase superfamily II)
MRPGRRTASGALRVGRRAFLAGAGRLGAGILLSSATVACSDIVADTDSGASATPDNASPSETATGGASEDGATGMDWHRVDLGFVSAYLLVGDADVVVVDTGVEGSAGDIEEALGELGLGWYAVTDVVLTHHHPDHIGGLPVVASETEARVYAGTDDIANITGASDITALDDGDQIGGLRVIATPGHTPGHISILDPATRVLVAGDALVGRADGAGADGPDPAFTQDMDIALDSVRTLATLDVETVLFGHGEPLESDAGRLLEELAAEL